MCFRASPARPSRVLSPLRRGGLTLVELLAVIAIIGLLVGLLMPAIQRARESSRRTTCTSNIKTLALASLSHLEHIGTFPSGGCQGGQGISGPFKIGARNGFAEEQAGGFFFNILPFMELDSLRNLGSNAKSESPPVIGCPTTIAPGVAAVNPAGEKLGVACYSGSYGSQPRHAPVLTGTTPDGRTVLVTGATSSGEVYLWDLPKEVREATYPSFTNYGHRVGGNQWRFNDGVICTFGRVRAAHVTDGLGNTLLCAERPVRVQNVYAWTSNDNPIDTGNTNGGGWVSNSGWWTPLSSKPPQMFIQGFPYTGVSVGGFGSRHSDTFAAAFCDGSVRHVGFEIDAVTLWPALGSRNDRQILNLPW